MIFFFPPPTILKKCCAYEKKVYICIAKVLYISNGYISYKV